MHPEELKKHLTPELLTKLGISTESLKKRKTIEELAEYPPGMVIATAKKTFSFSINNSSSITWKKGTDKVLSTYIYLSLEKGIKGESRLKPNMIPFAKLYKPYRGENLDNKNILIWRTGGYGDLCFIQPSLLWMKKQWPTCKIYFTCAPSYMPLIQNWDCIDQIIGFPVSADYINKCNYHCTYEGVIERCEEAETTNSYRLFSKWMGLNIPDKELRPILTTLPSCDKIRDEFLKKNKINHYEYITAQLRSSTPIRTPGTMLWAKIFIPLLEDGHRIVITDSPRMRDRLDAFIKLAIPEKYRNQIFNFSPYSTEIPMSISLLAKSKLAISPDTSMIHLAQGVECPTLGIYGPFGGEMRMDTYKNADWVEPSASQVCKFNGKYCYLHGQTCEAIKPGGTAPCYEFLNFEEIYDKCNKLLLSKENGYERK
jgi:ADP-heptose:LPS heptosyltransferase